MDQLVSLNNPDGKSIPSVTKGKAQLLSENCALRLFFMQVCMMHEPDSSKSAIRGSHPAQPKNYFIVLIVTCDECLLELVQASITLSILARIVNQNEKYLLFAFIHKKSYFHRKVFLKSDK